MRGLIALVVLVTVAGLASAGNCLAPSAGLRLTTVYQQQTYIPPPAAVPLPTAATYGDCGGGASAFAAGGAYYPAGVGFAGYNAGFRTVNYGAGIGAGGYGYGGVGFRETVRFRTGGGFNGGFQTAGGGGGAFFGVQAGRVRAGISFGR